MVGEPQAMGDPMLLGDGDGGLMDMGEDGD